MGVLCEISDRGGWRDAEDYTQEYQGYNGVLPPDVVNWAGMDTNDGLYDLAAELSLVKQNDEGLTFDQIADLIDQHWREL